MGARGTTVVSRASGVAAAGEADPERAVDAVEAAGVARGKGVGSPSREPAGVGVLAAGVILVLHPLSSRLRVRRRASPPRRILAHWLAFIAIPDKDGVILSFSRSKNSEGVRSLP